MVPNFLKNIIFTDFGFLLRFLRNRKYSQLEARKNLENFWTAKTCSPEWHRNIDPTDPVLQEIIRTGYEYFVFEFR